MITQNELEILCRKVEDQLCTCKKIQIYGATNWTTNLPKLPGIYVVWNGDNQIVYVGETSNLQERMNDLKDTRHHTLRRTVGNMEFSIESDFQKASSKLKFSPRIENMVAAFFEANLSLTYCATKIGRKEFEEYNS